MKWKKTNQRCFKRWWLAYRSSHFPGYLSEQSCSKHFKDARMPAVLWRCEHESNNFTAKRDRSPIFWTVGSVSRDDVWSLVHNAKELLVCRHPYNASNTMVHSDALDNVSCDMPIIIFEASWDFHFHFIFTKRHSCSYFFCQQEEVTWPGPPWGGSLLQPTT